MKTDNHTNNILIREISAKETYAVRHPILREGRPIEDCEFTNDNLETTIHIGLYVNQQLVGVATFLENVNHQFSEKRQYQLRGMAILKAYQGRQLGALLLKHGEQLLKQKQIPRIWFNARETAVKFYNKNDYQTIGQSFEIDKVGTHYVMTKVI